MSTLSNTQPLANTQSVMQSSPLSPRRSLLMMAACFLVFYAGLSPMIASPIYDRMLFFPSAEPASNPAAIQGVQKQDVFFDAPNGAKLHGWFFKKPGTDKVVLISHGNAGNLTHRGWLIDIVLKAGASAFIYDYEGYGSSSGQATIPALCVDGVAAYDWIKRAEPSAKIVVLGESLGTGVACQIAAERSVSGVVLASAFQSLVTIARERMLLFRAFPGFMFPKQHLDSAAVLRKPHAPLLIIHGEKDTLIPISEAEKLFAAACEPKQLVRLPNSGHNDIYDTNDGVFESSLGKLLQAIQ
jgi:fermentation-respiration switch protein FrsA (DUF1100 family)